MNKELIGYDENGQVFDVGKVVLRKINNSYKQEVKEIFKAYKIWNLNKKGIVETKLLDDGNLQHKKLIVSYPYEWTANMFKDAVLFHLKMFSEAGKAGLTLKDALPNNIVFDCTTPVFIDFLSIVFPNKLKNEKWLNTERFKDPRVAIVDTMLLPYIIFPFLSMYSGEYGVARELLSIRSCNTGGKTPEWDDLFSPKIKQEIIKKGKYIRLFTLVEKLRLYRLLLRQNLIGFDKFTAKLVRMVSDSDVTPPRSAYSLYYNRKKEETSFRSPSKFLPKQKTVYDIIKIKKPKNVLDIGANTGWYSVLASRLGSEVIAIEDDESCVDILYKRAKKNRLNILPLKISFGELTKKIYGVEDNNPVYKNRGFKNNPLYRSGIERFKSELVLVLGLAHHLVLGQGYSIDKMFKILSQLTQSTLVLEFVDLTDEKIVNEPSFFKNINKFNHSNYSLDRFLEIGKKHFANVVICDSYPQTRKILVFNK